MVPLQHELFSSFQVVNLSRYALVNLNRFQVVSLDAFRVVNFIGFCIVKGKVTDKKTAEPIPGASIIIDKTNTGTQTDFDGTIEVT